MARANHCTFMGNLTRDPELRWVEVGGETRPVANFGLAVQRRTNRDEADFFEFSVWGKTAEALVEYKQKGDPLYVECEAQYRTWENDAGEKRAKVDFKAFNIQWLRGKNDEAREQQKKDQAEQEADEDFEDIPF